VRLITLDVPGLLTPITPELLSDTLSSLRPFALRAALALSADTATLFGLWRDMEFASFAHYVAERLGMAPRTVEQRVWLERRLYSLPALREAMRDGRLSYEKARLVAGCADDTTGRGSRGRKRPPASTCAASSTRARTRRCVRGASSASR
jgi:hypothetical protein